MALVQVIRRAPWQHGRFDEEASGPCSWHRFADVG